MSACGWCAQLLPALLELLGRFAPAIRHDHTLDLRAQLETIESLAGGFPHHPQALIAARDLPSGHVGHGPAAREGDPREIHDVGLARRQREEPRAVATDDDGRMRTLDGTWMDPVARDPVVLAGEINGGP